MKRAILSAMGCIVLILSMTGTPRAAQGPNILLSDAVLDESHWSIAYVKNITWHADATPAMVLGAPSFVSAPFSLNFNNGVDYVDGTNTPFATATAGGFDISGTTGVALVFQCMYQTETTGVGAFDQRRVQISSDNFVTYRLDAQCATTAPTGISACGAMGAWHVHTVMLTPAWGNVKIRFQFNAGDSLFNNYAGWFLDDIVLSSATPVPVPPGASGPGGKRRCGSDAASTSGSGVAASLLGAFVLLSLLSLVWRRAA